MQGVKLSASASDEVLAWAKKFRPQVDRHPESERGHAHPALAFARAAGEMECLKRIAQENVKGAVLDVGGNPVRAGRVAAELGLQYWSANPILSSEDVVRDHARRATHPDVKWWCNHRAEECSCARTALGTMIKVLLFVHSIYYFEPNTLAALMATHGVKHAYVVYHRFQDAEGVLPNKDIPESTWRYDGKRVEMTVRGNSHTYYHPNPTWIDQPGGAPYSYYQGETLKQGTLCFNEFDDIGGTVCATVVMTDLVFERPQALALSIMPEVHYDTSLDIDRLNEAMAGQPLFKSLEIRSGVVTRHGLIVEGKKKTYYVPRALYLDAKGHAALTSRNAAGFSAHVAAVKALFRARGYSAEYKENIPALAALSYVDGLEFDVAAMNAVASKVDQMGIVNRMLKFDFLPRVRWWRLVVLAVLVVSGLGVLSGVGVGAWEAGGFHGWWVSLPAAVILAATVGWLCVGAQRFGSAKGQGSRYDKFQSDATYVATVVPKIGTNLSKAASLVADTPVPDKTYAVVLGGHAPATPAGGRSNLALALNTRLGAGSTESPAWDELWADVRGDRDGFLAAIGWDVSVTLEVPTFSTWIEKDYSRRDEPQRVLALVQAHERAVADPATISLRDKPHVKDEVYPAKCMPKPRAIAAVNDEYIVTFAPYADTFAKYLKQQWNGEGDFLYANGYNAVELGAVFTKYQEGALLAIEWDASAAEGTVTLKALEFERNICLEAPFCDSDRVNFKLLFDEQLKPIHVPGMFTRTACRRSAVPNTGYGNTLLFLLWTLRFLRVEMGWSFGQSVGTLKRIGLGDDGAAFIHNQQLAERLLAMGVGGVAAWTKRHFGFNLELKFHHPDTRWAQLEFCSGWFVPRKLGERTGYVWTPKVGRVLAKSFAVKAKEDHPWAVLRGTAVQFSQAACPLLSAFATSYAGAVAKKTRLEIKPKHVDGALKLCPAGETCDETYAAVRLRYGLDPEKTEAFLAKAGHDPIVNLPATESVAEVLLYVDVCPEEPDVMALKKLDIGHRTNTTGIDKSAVADGTQYPAVDPPPAKAKPAKPVPKAREGLEVVVDEKVLAAEAAKQQAKLERELKKKVRGDRKEAAQKKKGKGEAGPKDKSKPEAEQRRQETKPAMPADPAAAGPAGG